MAKRPSLADSLMASLNKGVHVDTAEKIARGFTPVPDEAALPTPTVESIVVAVPDPIVEPVIIKQTPVVVSAPQVVEPSVVLSKEPAPSDGLSVSPLDGDTVTQSDHDTVSPYISQTVIPSDTKSVTRSNTQTVSGVHPQTVSQYQTVPQTVLGYIPLDVLNLAFNQACILEYLINNTSGITNARAISDTTHITIPSVREALQRLVAKGFMHKPVTMKNAAFQGFSYVLNKALCDHFINAGGLSQDNYRRHQTVHETVSGFEGATVRHSDGKTVHSSSNSLLESKNLTTTSSPDTVSPSKGEALTPSDPHITTPSKGDTLTPSNGFILTGGVGAYWEEEGLGEGQAQKWCSQFEIDPEQMKMQLDWARFDLEINGRRGEVKKDPVSWFFGHLRTTGGCFPRPVNYKSPIEIRAEALKVQQEKDLEAKASLESADFENRFQEFLKNPDSNLYNQLLSQVTSFAADQAKDGDRMAVEIELRDLFKATQN
ncbi:MAG: helix-turn-helix domain-containing protein [Betaproteobacteria bacterium]|nr:helix-turn-helix domain-containing protein [Betaproteobacteria bacterium]